MKAIHFIWLVQRACLPNVQTLLPRGYFTPAVCRFSSSKSFMRLSRNNHDDIRVKSEQEPSSCADFSQRPSGDDNYVDEDYAALYSKYNSVSKEHGVPNELENNEYECDATIDIISVDEALGLVRNKLFEDANQNKDLSDSKAVAADLCGRTSSSMGNSDEKEDEKSLKIGSDKWERKAHALQRNKTSMANSWKITDNSSKESSYKVPSNRKKIVIKKKENSVIYENHRKILNDSATTSTSSELRCEKAFISDSLNVESAGVLNSQSKDFLNENKKLNMKQSRENRKEEREKKKVALIKSIQADKNTSMYRESPLRIQMLSTGLHQQLYGEKQFDDTEQQEDVLRSINHLKDHDFWGREPSVAPDVDFQLPSLRSKDLCQHFEIIAEEQSAPYKNLLGKLINKEIPPKPTEWNYEAGWSQYREDGTVTKVDYPECKAIVLDVEVCTSEGNQPTLAVAVSDKHWYSWCSEQLINSNSVPQREVILCDLIPLEGMEDEPRIVVGHNVSFDRVRVKEQYSIALSKLRFLDTMSMHISVSGLSQEQRSLYLKNKGSRSEYNHPWMLVGSPNNLSDVYKFHCKTDGLKKDIREVFIKGYLEDVRSDFQNLVSYCASDVHATYHILQKLYPVFQERLPHPASFSGMLEMGTALLPVNEHWNRYISSSESEYEKMEHILNEELVKQARDALHYQENSKYSEDLWLWDLDWTTPKGRVKKLQGYPSWYRKLCVKTGTRENTPEPEKMSTSLQVVPKLLKLTWNGYPLHYEKKYGWGYLIPEFEDFSTLQEKILEKSEAHTSSKKQPVFPVKALYELHSTLCEKKKSTEVVSEEFEDVLEIGIEDLDIDDQVLKKTKSRLSGISKDGKDIGIPGVLLVPLPHRDGPGNRVGNPLAKDFLTKIESKVLSSYVVEIAELVLRTSKVLSYWRNNRDRILSQMVIWEDVNESEEDAVENSQKPENMNPSKVGFIVPQVVTAGTITRRGVEKTWMTASNAYADRIGSELKAMVQAPPGYHLVGADVDSQELWIAAVLGDAYFAGLHGSTALGWMVLQGSKSDGTDMHSRTAATATISRDHAKVLNYGRIYGAGLRFIERLLHQFNPKLTKEETKQKAKDLMEATKGQKVWWLSKEGKQSLEDIGVTVTDRPFSRKEVYSFGRALRKQHIEASFQDITDGKAQWFGGTESYMFNCLEAIAQCDQPRTPVLRARITQALESQYVEDQFMPSRINWVVQSSAVDYLHLMLVCMKWLMEEYNIKGRFCISIHDEVRYLVASEDRYRAALALHITNLLTRTIFSLKLGMKDLPLSVAFFSGVDIDKVLRKEPNADCITPSNPKGLRKGYNVAFGETLDIYKTLEITKGRL